MGGGGVKEMKQKSPKSTLLVDKHTRVDNNKTNKANSDGYRTFRIAGICSRTACWIPRTCSSRAWGILTGNMHDGAKWGWGGGVNKSQKILIKNTDREKSWHDLRKIKHNIRLRTYRGERTYPNPLSQPSRGRSDHRKQFELPKVFLRYKLGMGQGKKNRRI